ncbi:MAG: hypothetical protein RLZZ230_919 [Candidatus Parcubacteria bacterium]|jgi:tetratricopeptide (TPR) repeat protein
MAENLFIPKMDRVTEAEVAAPVARKVDFLQRIIQYGVVVLFGLLPIFFTPHVWASLGFSKVMLAISFGSVIMILLCFQALRRTHVSTVFPVSLGLYWLMVAAATASAYLTGDIQDAVRGSMMETQTVAFLATIGLVMSLPLVLQNSKEMSLKALTFFGVTAALLLTYNIIRIIFGANLLPFQTFGQLTVSPIGNFYDLAIFCGLIIIFGLVTLVQLPLKALLQYFIAGLITAALILLMFINFFSVWLIVGLFALIIITYQYSRSALFGDTEQTPEIVNSRVLKVTTGIVCVISALFIISGQYWEDKISSIAGISYIDVRPSLTSTFDITKSVYKEDALLGVGPNQFSTAWRQFKDPIINQTVYWNTEFIAGNSFISTLFISLGLLGGVLMVFFHLSFLHLGYRMFLRTKRPDSYWYYFGIVSFAAACYLWAMAYLYVPGTTNLLLAAFFTGLTFVAAGALLPTMPKMLPLVTNRRRGFSLMALVVVMVVGFVSILFVSGKQYIAQASFNEAYATATSIPQFEVAANRSYSLFKDDRFIAAKAQFKLGDLNNLMSIQEPSEEDVKKFAEVSSLAVDYAQKTVESDPTNPSYQAILASVYGNLALAGISGAQERFDSALAEAMRLDPLNPEYYLIDARMASRNSDAVAAREKIGKALALKPNYTEALYFLTQLDIGEGNVEAAIAVSKDMISLEPNNQALYLQLGILLSSNNNLTDAEAVFKRAIEMDPQYANARYFLAIVYLNTERSQLALEELKLVKQTNEDNTELAALIGQIESGTFKLPQDMTYSEPIKDAPSKDGGNDVVTTEGTGIDANKTDSTAATKADESVGGSEVPVTETNQPEPNSVPAE